MKRPRRVPLTHRVVFLDGFPYEFAVAVSPEYGCVDDIVDDLIRAHLRTIRLGWANAQQAAEA